MVILCNTYRKIIEIYFIIEKILFFHNLLNHPMMNIIENCQKKHIIYNERQYNNMLLKLYCKIIVKQFILI